MLNRFSSSRRSAAAPASGSALGRRFFDLGALSLALSLGYATPSLAAQALLQWGTDNVVTRTSPADISSSGALSGKTVSQVGSGLFTVALCTDNTLTAWGFNFNGSVGDGTTTNRAAPVNITGKGALAGKTVTQIAVGYLHALALCSDGTVVAWGFNGYGQLGIGNNEGVLENQLVPVDITNNGDLAGKRVIQLAAGEKDSFALCDDGSIVAWGNNDAGQLGTGDGTSYDVPVSITGRGALAGKTVSQIRPGTNHTLALCSDGTLAAWGFGGDSALGTGNTNDQPNPVAINNIAGSALLGKTVTQIVAGFYYSMALCSDGTLATWGSGSGGALGNASVGDKNKPTAINNNTVTNSALNGKTVTQIAAGIRHGLVLCDDNTVIAWGENSNGEVGVGNKTIQFTPVNITSNGNLSGKKAIRVVAGGWMSDALATFDTAPIVTTGSATAITTNSATLGATVNPSGLATTAKIQYGLTTSYDQEASLTLSPTDGSTDQSVSANVTGLLPHKLYHYRVSATNSVNTTNGADKTFTTLNTAPLITNNGLTLNERTSAPLGTANLNATDGDGDTLTFTLTTLPTQGVLKKNNVALVQGNSFTAADIAGGLVSYEHTGVGSDSFGYSLSDGFSTTPGTFSISVTPVPPTVVSSTRVNANPTNAASVQFTVVFSEAVTGVDASDFSLITFGLTGVSVVSVSGSGTTYTVTVNTGSGAGTLNLGVGDNDSIVDSTGNPLGGTGLGNGVYSSGQIYDVDHVAPTVAINQASGQSDPTGVGSVEFTVQFSESVTGFSASDVVLSGTSNVGTANVQVSGSGSTYTVTVSGLTKAGTVIATIGAGAATDAAGNTSNASTSNDNSVLYGHAPSALTLSRSSVQEKLPVGSFVGLLSSTDSDAGETFTYSLVGGDTNAFTIDGAYLRTNAVFDEAVKGSYNLTIRTTDSTGLSFDQAFVISVIETTKPSVAISSPSLGQKVLINALTGDVISGTATDNKGVVAVKVRLSRKRGTTNEYWNGSAWVATQFFLNATVTTVGDASVTWALNSGLPPANLLDSGPYALQVYALDAANNKSDYANTTFNILQDVTPPTLTLSTPTANQKLLIEEFNGSAVNGTVGDDMGSPRVKVRLSRKRGTTNEYWNGTDFVATSSYVDGTVNGTTWSLGAATPSADKLDSGLYQVEAYAVDGGNNKSATAKASFTLSTDFVAPTVAISTPAPSQVIKINEFGTGTLSGTASDNLGVVSVQLKLQRKRGTEVQYWNGSAFTPTVATFAATYNAGTWSYDTAIPASALDAGGYTLYATAFDAADNKTTTPSRSFSIVGTPSASDAVSVQGASSANGS